MPFSPARQHKLQCRRFRICRRAGEKGIGSYARTRRRRLYLLRSEFVRDFQCLFHLRASTSCNADVFAFAAAQVKKALEVTHELGGEGYTFCDRSSCVTSNAFFTCAPAQAAMPTFSHLPPRR